MPKLELSNICDKVYETLSEQILNYKLKPGERLREEQLAKELGVSRTPVRDAISRLVKEGFARMEPRKGASVNVLEIEDIIEIYDIRIVLESLAVRLAVANVDVRELQRLEKNFSEKSGKALLKADTELHDYILKCSGNKKLIEILSNLHSLVQVFRSAGYAIQERTIKATTDHIDIIKALMKGESTLAETAMQKHIQKTKADIIKIFKQT